MAAVRNSTFEAPPEPRRVSGIAKPVVSKTTTKGNTALREVDNVRALEHGADAPTPASLVVSLAKKELSGVAQTKLFEINKRAGDAVQRRSPRTKAAVDAVAPQVVAMAQATATKLASSPEAAAKAKALLSVSSKAEIPKALGKLAPEVGKAFTSATGAKAMNTEVVAALLRDLPAAAKKVAPSLSDDVAKHALKLEAKLGVKAAGKTAGMASKAVPYLGNAVAVACTAVAGATLIKEAKKRPPDGEKLAKEGCNTLLQGVGIAFPWVALGGDLVDLGWSARIATRDGKKAPTGEAVERERETKANSAKELAPLIEASSKVLESTASSNGKAGLATAFADLASNVADRGATQRAGQAAMLELSAQSSMDLKAAAKALPSDDEHANQLKTLSDGFSTLFATLHQTKSLSRGATDKRQANADKLLEVLRQTTEIAASLAPKS